MNPRRVVIMGAAGRDFHNFNVVFRESAEHEVVAFTAAQIPGIAGRSYPPELAGRRYPAGIPIEDESRLASLIRERGVHEVVFAYSDVAHEEVMHRASIALAMGADFRLLGPAATQLVANRPVVAVCATRTGAGKSQVTRWVARLLRAMGFRVAPIRHPMPYGDLAKQAAQRFASRDDLDAHGCTIEEREEYEPLLEAVGVAHAGVDYARILERAEAEADVLIWDGGNNDLPFLRPDLHIVVADPHRAGHELRYHPGEANLRAADVVLINKVDTARPDDVATVRRNVAAANPSAIVIETASPIRVENPSAISGRRVLVVEDGPTLTHGGMPFGAGWLAARRHGASSIVDPRPFAVGSLVGTFRAHPHIGPVLPAMGYSAAMIRELAETIHRTGVDCVVAGTPIDLERLLGLETPVERAHYDIEELGPPRLEGLLRECLADAFRSRASN